MRIGILADSHGRVTVTAHAVRTLLDAGAEMLIHLGDVEREQVIESLAGHNAHIVFGNCDWNADALARCATHLGVTVDDPIGRINIGSKHITFTHGHLLHLMQQALADGTDFLLHGHTHQLRDERIGSTRVINPGALFRAPRYTVGVLDPETDTLEIIELTKAPRRTAT